ncbi:hypothetical protein GJAV_G00135970 [Gymnothorax javanicus]|nr:hypothetical protein GJAV_G00135970 [Gymnothorax javanicus]
MASPVFPGEDGLPVLGRDRGFMEVIGRQMRVPDRLRVGSGPVGEDMQDRDEEPHVAYSMQVPDRLSLIEASDLSPRPMFSTPVRPSSHIHAGAKWDSPPPSVNDPLLSPLRRSYSDHTFGRSASVTPVSSKQMLHAPSLKNGRGPPQHPDPAPPIPPFLLSPKSMLQVAKSLGQQASHHLLRTVTEKYGSRFSGVRRPPTDEAPHLYLEQSRRSAVDSWACPVEEGGGDVEMMVLRRQVLKMSRRLAALERQNQEHRRTELLLFALLGSACLLNSWLWLRR